MAKVLNIHPDSPQERKIQEVVELLNRGGLIIYPTDSVYAYGCSIHSSKAIERINKIRGFQQGEHEFSFIFEDISQISKYVRSIDTAIFKTLKRNLPGPFTFILNANKSIPKGLQKKGSKTLGVRIPESELIHQITKALGHPLLTSSAKTMDDIQEYYTEPSLIAEKHGQEVDLIINGGLGNLDPSTVVDCTEGNTEIIRQGLGDLV